jgi:hypothetical protein
VSDAKVASFAQLSLEQQFMRSVVNNRLWKRCQLSFLMPCLSDEVSATVDFGMLEMHLGKHW